MSLQATRIVLAERPTGPVLAEHFRSETFDPGAPAEGEALLRHIWLSLDPYMRGRMSAARSYAKPVEIGETMTGEAVAEVIASRNAKFAVGDIVAGANGWATHSRSDGRGLRKIDARAAPLQSALGVLGMPGMTAYVGLKNIGQPKAGETLVVAAATGPVGSAVGQIAKIAGARTVGVAGGPEKARLLTEEFGFDVGLDHRAPDFEAQLAAACPDGIDVYFENVGGRVWSAVLPLLNDFSRVPVCGLVSQYSATAPAAGPDQAPAMMRIVLTRRVLLRGFIVYDFAEQAREFRDTMTGWIAQGRVRWREHVIEGLAGAPQGLAGLLQGRHTGKTLVRVGADPA